MLLQELQSLIDEANQSLEESGTPSHEIMVIVLHREFSAGTIGIKIQNDVLAIAPCSHTHTPRRPPLR